MPTDDITLISEKLNQAMKDSQQFSAPFNEALLPIPIAKKYLAFAESCAKQTSMG